MRFYKFHFVHISSPMELYHPDSKDISFPGFEVYNLSKDSTLPNEIIPKTSVEEALKLANERNQN